jgi:phosphatidylserine/phosphatidylglycerophosphate/cardiolipin synthase-like enzyme
MIRRRSAAGPRVLFGGPDQPPRVLRDLLEERVETVPAGGSIDWMTYYFRDRQLARALVRAHRRGVAVKLCVDGRPRNARANDEVLRILSGADGIGDGLRVVETRLPGHLHTKLYCFSHPQPAALVGSFNPSGDEPEDASVIADIGDQDRGHNLLVDIDEPILVDAFVAHVRDVHAGISALGALVHSRSAPRAADFTAFFFPRYGRNPLDRRFARLGPGATLRIAASHFKDRQSARQLAKLAARGVAVEVLTHHTMRRSPEAVVEYLRERGVRTYRYEHPQELPMHAKFLLAEDGEHRWSAFGSYNLNRTSRWLNQELLVFSTDPDLWRTLEARWHAILAEPWCKS